MDWVSWALVLIGWFVVHRTTLERERRKENREIAARIIDSLYALCHDGRQFHTSKEFNEELSFDISQKLGRIFREINLPPISNLKISNEKLMEARMALTLKNFEKSSFKKHEPSSPLVQDVTFSIEELVSEIETKARTMFR